MYVKYNFQTIIKSQIIKNKTYSLVQISRKSWEYLPAVGVALEL